MKITVFLVVLMKVILTPDASLDIDPEKKNLSSNSSTNRDNITFRYISELSQSNDSVKSQPSLVTYSEKVKQLCEPLSYLRNYSDIRESLLSVYSTRETCLAMSVCQLQSAVGGRCGAFIDPLGTCFLETEYNETAHNVCPELLNDIPYYPDNVTRECLSNGSWATKTDYSACRPVLDEGMICNALKAYFESGDRKTFKKEVLCESYLSYLRAITYMGRTVSLVSLTVAFLIFWKLRSIRCWRNIIHWNLSTSFILRNVMWFVLNCTIDYKSRRFNTVLCRILVTIFNYSQVTNYFWMLVEGLYLHIMVVLAYSSNKIKLRYYFLVGWGFPLPVIALWVILKANYEDSTCWMHSSYNKLADYSYQIPIFVILVINAGILANIVRILVTKLRSQGRRGDTARFGKAVKAAFFLFPLLGVTYLVFLVSPEKGTIGEIVFLFLNTFLQSFQGFFVCIIYCFANKEIRQAIANELRSWKHHHHIPCLQENGKKIRRSSMSFSRTTFTTAMNYKAKAADDRKSSKRSTSTLSPTSSKANAIALTEMAYTPARHQASAEISLAKDKYSDTSFCLSPNVTPEHKPNL